MSSYLSDWVKRLAGGGGVEKKEAVGEDWSTAANAESVPWIRISAASKGSPQIVCNPKASQDVLHHVGESPVNLVSIFGAARQGKSFLMNLLAGQEGIFKISNSKDPCTQGVDISKKILHWGAFHRLDDREAVKETPRLARASSEPMPRIAFVDCEGQGDRDATYDANLICPILLASKVAIFNWKDSLQRDRLLNLLAVMQRAAYNVSTEDEDGNEDNENNGDGNGTKGGGKIFGHLHIVFRDWTYQGDVESVRKTLFTPERVATPDATARNELRRVLEASFESISVWLLPPPVERTSELSKALSPKDLSSEFKSQVNKLRHALAEQLQTPHHFHGRVLTGSKIAGLVPTVARELNSGKTVLPKSAYMSLLEAEVARAQLNFLTRVQEALEAVKAEAEKAPIASSNLRIRLQAEIHKLQREFDRWSASLGDSAMQQEAANTFTEHCTKAVEEVLVFNRQHYLSSHLTKAARRAKEQFDEKFTVPIKARLPLSPEVLVLEAQRARAAAEATVKSVVVGEPEVEEVLRDALEIVTGHAELQVSKVEKVNRDKLQEVQNEEGQVFDAAKGVFTDQFFDKLGQLKAKGPIQETAFLDAYKRALAAGKTHISTTLANGITGETRKAELVHFLEEIGQVIKNEQGALYQLRCTQDATVETMNAVETMLEKATALSKGAGGEPADVSKAFAGIKSEGKKQLQDKLAALASGAPEETTTLCLQSLGSVADRIGDAVVAGARIQHGVASKLKEAEAEGKKLHAEIKKLQGVAKDKEAELRQKDAELKGKGGEIQGKAAEVKELEGKVKQKEAELKERDGKLKAKDSELKEREEGVKEREAQLQEKEGELAEKEAELDELRKELKAAQEAAAEVPAVQVVNKKRKAKGEPQEEDQEEENGGEAAPMDTDCDGNQGTTPAGGRNKGAAKSSRRGSSTPAQARKQSAEGGPGSGSKLEQARLEERQRIEEETKRRVTRGKK